MLTTISPLVDETPDAQDIKEFVHPVSWQQNQDSPGCPILSSCLSHHTM
jgi:hypothetical protein